MDAALGRMAKFQEEIAKSIPVVPTVPGLTQQVKIPELVLEVEQLRSREMEMEREEARKKRSRSLSVPSPLEAPSGVASTARPAHRTAQRGDHGDLHQSREHVGSEFQPVQPIGLSPARQVVAWARGVRVSEAQNPGPDDTVERTQVDGGAHSTEESGAAGTVRQESDTESVTSVNEATVPAPQVGSRRRRMVLVGANPPPNHVAEEVDLTVADSPSESGDSSAAVAEEVVHDQIPQNSRRNFELTRRALTAGLECLDQVELHNVFRTRALVMKNVPFMMNLQSRVDHCNGRSSSGT